jgi:hypothetical protein
LKVLKIFLGMVLGFAAFFGSALLYGFLMDPSSSEFEPILIMFCVVGPIVGAFMGWYLPRVRAKKRKSQDESG